VREARLIMEKGVTREADSAVQRGDLPVTTSLCTGAHQPPCHPPSGQEPTDTGLTVPLSAVSYLSSED
jgi:hypothetical protein